ncbi:energy transducer TonB [Gilvimarinus sp. F26214L]|uniref:energy transducer TonB n=1 Tax=Gilvimarinus sp. DZF01 TaxID=3461371 RepID=UPI004046020D
MEKQLAYAHPIRGLDHMGGYTLSDDSAGQPRRFVGALAKYVLTGCLAASLPALAQQPPTEADQLSPASPASTGSLLRPSEGVEDFRDAIARLEAEQGAWGSGLAEQLSGLGQNYQLRGLHRDAIAIFDRAVHVSRINNGLYDLSQVPIIERMVESLKARGLWEEVHKRHQYLYWLHKRNYGAEDPRMLPVIDRLGKWYISDYALNPQRRVMTQLVDAHDLFQHAIQIITGTYGQQDLRLIEPLRGVVMSNWFFANYRGENTVTVLEREQVARDLQADQVAYVEQEDNRLTQYLRNNYVDGKQAIEQMVEIYSNSPDAPPGAAAYAKIELADWQQLFERRKTAGDLYKEAYQELAANEATRAQAEKVFDEPVALPALDLIESDLEQPAETDEAAEPIRYVLVSFDVNRFGEAKNIEVVESQPEDAEEHYAEVKRSLEGTRFRPRMINGEPVDTEGQTQKFVFSES